MWNVVKGYGALLKMHQLSMSGLIFCHLCGSSEWLCHNSSSSSWSQQVCSWFLEVMILGHVKFEQTLSWQMWPTMSPLCGDPERMWCNAPYLKRSSESTRSLLFLLLEAIWHLCWMQDVHRGCLEIVWECCCLVCLSIWTELGIILPTPSLSCMMERNSGYAWTVQRHAGIALWLINSPPHAPLCISRMSVGDKICFRVLKTSCENSELSLKITVIFALISVDIRRLSFWLVWLQGLKVKGVRLLFRSILFELVNKSPDACHYIFSRILVWA